VARRDARLAWSVVRSVGLASPSLRRPRSARDATYVFVDLETTGLAARLVADSASIVAVKVARFEVVEIRDLIG